MWVKVSASWWGAFPLHNHFVMHFQIGSVLCLYNKVSLLSPMRGGVAFTLVVSHCDHDWISGGMASIDALVLQWVWVAGPSAGDAVTEMMRMLVATASFLGTSTNYDRQSAALFCAPDIHSKVMLYVDNSSDHQFTLLLAFSPLRNFAKGMWSLCTMISDPWR